MAPLVSVIVPAYNHQKYIGECINSIHNQTFNNYELIVIDDGSQDDTPKILVELQKKYGFQLYIQENAGLSFTLTKYIREVAKGKYIAVCASDDFWPEDKLAIQVEYMERTDAAMSYGKAYYIDTESKLIDKLSILNKPLKGGHIFEDIITQKFHLSVNYMIKKSVLEEMGYYKEGIVAEDFYMNCLISHKYPILFIDEYLCYYRVEELRKKRDPLKLHLDHRKTIDIFSDEKIYQEAVSRWNLRMFYLASYRKFKIKSLYYMLLSLKYIHKKAFYSGIYRLLFKWL